MRALLPIILAVSGGLMMWPTIYPPADYYCLDADYKVQGVCHAYCPRDFRTHWYRQYQWNPCMRFNTTAHEYGVWRDLHKDVYGCPPTDPLDWIRE